MSRACLRVLWSYLEVGRIHLVAGVAICGDSTVMQHLEADLSRFEVAMGHLHGACETSFIAYSLRCGVATSYIPRSRYGDAPVKY